MSATQPPEMSPERWRQVQWLFDAVLEKSPEERPQFLEQITVADPALRHEVASLIRSLESASQFLEMGAVEMVAGEPGASGPGVLPEDSSSIFAPGIRVGVYRLERLLGSGGAGQVFLAIRDDEAFEKQVAVKVIKRGMDTDELVRRFVSERQILAQLEHPNIAQLLDGGATDDGRPYLVMEYVDGLPIDRWCEEQKLGFRARLELFLAVCDAVHFAHSNLVVHRDLKPGNILVGADGAPKLLDFGIAKLLDPTTFPRTVLPTVPGWRAMTPEYASPEQVRGAPVTTASDVYSLGVVLYELLTGQRPYRLAERTPAEIEQVVCHQEPQQASRAVRDTPTTTVGDATTDRVLDGRELERYLSGDLDDILRMALEKEVDQRYRSVDRLADDVRRHLQGRPVLARKPTFFYRASKFVRRNRLPVGAASLVFSLLLVFLLVLRREQFDTVQQRDRAELISEFMTGLFEVSDPSRERGETVTARELLDRGVRDAEARLRERPEVLGEVLGTMGATYTNLGLYGEAERLLERSLELRSEAHGVRDPTVATARQQLADLALATDDLVRAEGLAREALALRIRRLGEDHPAVVESRFLLALIRRQQGATDEAGELLALAESGARDLGLDEQLISILWRSGLLARYLDDSETALERLDAAREVAERFWGENHPEVAQILNQLSLVELDHDPARAEALLERALAIQQKVYKEPHPDTVEVLNNRAVLAERLGRLDEAEARYREVLAFQKTIAPDASLIEGWVSNNLARLMAERGELDEARALYRRSLDIHRRLLGPRHEETANVLNNLGSLAWRMGRVDDAERLQRQALEILLETVGAEHSRLAPVYNNLGELAARRGDHEGAQGSFEAAAEVLRGVSAQHRELPVVLQNLAATVGKLGQGEQAEALYVEALEVMEATGDINSTDAAVILGNLTVARIRGEKLDEAQASGWRAIEVYEALDQRGSAGWLRVRRYVAYALEQQANFDRAETLAAETLEVCESVHAEAVAALAENATTEAAEAAQDPCTRHRDFLARIRAQQTAAAQGDGAAAAS